MAHELYHHGILGMKWGVRRYQNPDGSLTPMGKLRYGTEESLQKSHARKEAKKAHNTAYKNRGTLSDAELNKSIERLQLEKKLKELTEEDTKKGETIVKRILTKSAETAITNVATATFTATGKYAVSKIIDSDAISKTDLAKKVFNS